MASPKVQHARPKFEPGDPAAFQYMTNIDRRKCKREVPLRLLCLGCSRTGTASLRQALIELGYTDTYHFSAPMQENPPDQLLWIEAMEAKFLGKGRQFERADWDQLLGHCQAVTDTPCRIFYKELLEAYPDAQVILTERDDEHQWFDSMMDTIVPWFATFIAPPKTLSARVQRATMPMDPTLFRFSELVGQCCSGFRHLIPDIENGTDTAKDWYLAYNAEIKGLVPKEKLLVMNVKQGWEPLCEFLGREPPSRPFPKVNDKLSFAKNTQATGEVMKKEVLGRMSNHALVGATLVAVAAAILGIARYL